MKKKKSFPYEQFMALSDARKEAAYRECEDEDIILKAKPLTPEMRRLWNRAKRKGGRPKIGRGCTRVLISIERGLLQQADDAAQKQNMSRSELFARGIRSVLATAD